MKFLLNSTKKAIYIGAFGLLALAFAGKAYSASPIRFDGGYYTNLFGSGQDADSHDGDFCDPEEGKCDGDDKAYVVKFVCDGRKTECTEHDSESKWTKGEVNLLDDYDTYNRSYSPSHKVKIKCDQTIQIDVFDKQCRVGDDGWECNDNNLKDYMVFYNACEEVKKPPICVLEYSPKEGPVPLTVKFDATGSFDNDGTIAKYIWDFGDGSTGEGIKPEHEYTKDGNFKASLIVEDNLKDQSSKCEVEINAKKDNGNGNGDDDDNDDDNNGDDDNDDDNDDNNGDDNDDNGDDDDSDGIVLSAVDPKGKIASGVSTSSPRTGFNNLYIGIYLLILGVMIKILIDKMKKEGYLPNINLKPNMKYKLSIPRVEGLTIANKVLQKFGVKLVKIQ